MTADRPHTQIIVMAKAPRPGLAKTRLIPALGPAGAARLAQQMLVHAVAAAVESGVGDVTLCVTPDVHDPAFTALADAHGVRLIEQGAGDLGERMARAFAQVLQALQDGQRAVMIGTDAPAVDATMLRQATRALDTHDAVLAPAADGGYALIGLRQFHPALFDSMPWSTQALMARTRSALQALGLRHHELPTVHDVDEPQDLVHVPATWLNPPARP
jgi:uncharacterized protein